MRLESSQISSSISNILTDLSSIWIFSCFNLGPNVFSSTVTSMALSFIFYIFLIFMQDRFFFFLFLSLNRLSLLTAYHIWSLWLIQIIWNQSILIFIFLGWLSVYLHTIVLHGLFKVVYTITSVSLCLLCPACFWFIFTSLLF